MIRESARLRRRVTDGTVICFSDAHYWPGEITTAHRALVRISDMLAPDVKLVIANGDILDGARISKHQRIGWQNCPKLADEIDTCKARLKEIQVAALPAHLIWCLGNHDARFETYLANNAAEFAGVEGFTLREHFPNWTPCWSVQINDDLIIKHRWKGGKLATLKNTIESGMSVVTGHLHSSKVSPYSDYKGTRFGVDCGTLADPYGPQFTAYTEDAPVDWRSGFVVLTFKDGKLLWPEMVYVLEEGKVCFRGKVMEV